MSGHSKWSQIKRQKGANDAKRGAIFTKMAPRDNHRRARGRRRSRRQLTGSAWRSTRRARRTCPPTTSSARSRRPSGGSAAEQYEEIVYEGYGPGGVAILVEAATDNKNRTVGGRAVPVHQEWRVPRGCGRGRVAVRAARRRRGRSQRAGSGRHRAAGDRRRGGRRRHRVGSDRGGDRSGQPGGACATRSRAPAPRSSRPR